MFYDLEKNTLTDMSLLNISKCHVWHLLYQSECFYWKLSLMLCRSSFCSIFSVAVFPEIFKQFCLVNQELLNLELLMDVGLSVACAIPSFWGFFHPFFFFFLPFHSFFFSYHLFSILNLCRASIVMSEFNDCDFFGFLCNYLSFNLNYFYFLFVFCRLSCPVFWADVIV